MSNQWLTIRHGLDDDPQERAAALLDDAGQAKSAGEPERALLIYDELIATAPAEDAQYAAA